jgi:hypothetical protein
VEQGHADAQRVDAVIGDGVTVAAVVVHMAKSRDHLIGCVEPHEIYGVRIEQRIAGAPQELAGDAEHRRLAQRNRAGRHHRHTRHTDSIGPITIC